MDDKENDEDNNFKFDDDDEKSDCAGGCVFFVRKMAGCRSTLLAFCFRHKLYIGIALLVILLVLYFAYFGYAMSYEFGDEGSIRLLWLTCLVLVVLLLKLLICCLSSVCMSTRSCITWNQFNWIRNHQKSINWSVAYF